ncbi:MAG TPA: endonuclease/exonuclease/phosphatase family protein [Acetobacteraceae bacterium]|nr:endonuclease/exonuclease/phosphatase family protein [Acetobacteraceae bacterium]
MRKHILAASLALGLTLTAGLAQAAEIKLATWNLEWMTARPAGDPALPADVVPKQPQDLDRLRHYADALDADVVAFQEVDGPAIAARLFPADRYALQFIDEDVVQQVGLAIHRDIPVERNPDVTGLDLYPEARHKLRDGLDVTLHLPGAATLRILAVHLKQGCQRDTLALSHRPACRMLRAQAEVLKNWIARRRAENVPFVVLGDFNRWMEGDDDFLATLQAPVPLLRATAGHASPCWGGERFIDHILAGDAARDWLRPETLRVLVYRETGDEWRERLSDHCPVSVRLDTPG